MKVRKKKRMLRIESVTSLFLMQTNPLVIPSSHKSAVAYVVHSPSIMKTVKIRQKHEDGSLRSLLVAVGSENTEC